MQAQTVARRVDEARMTWDELDRIATQHGLPERMLEAMFDAVLGYRVRRSGYSKRADVTDQTATRDLAALTSAGLLFAYGNGGAVTTPPPNRCSGSGNDSARSGSHFATRTRGCEPGSQSRSNKGFLRFAIPLTSSR